MQRPDEGQDSTWHGVRGQMLSWPALTTPVDCCIICSKIDGSLEKLQVIIRLRQLSITIGLAGVTGQCHEPEQAASLQVANFGMHPAWQSEACTF